MLPRPQLLIVSALLGSALSLSSAAAAAPVSFNFKGQVTMTQSAFVPLGERVRLTVSWDTAGDFETGPDGPGVCPDTFWADCWLAHVNATVGSRSFAVRAPYALLQAGNPGGQIGHNFGANLDGVSDYLAFVINLSHKELFAGVHPPGTLPRDTTALLDAWASDPIGRNFRAELRIPEPSLLLLFGVALGATYRRRVIS